MRRRLSLAFIGVAAASLVLTGVVTLLLSAGGQRRSTRDQLDQQVEEMANVLQLVGDTRQATLRSLAHAARVSGVTAVGLAPTGAVGPVPAGVVLRPDDIAALAAGATVRGGSGRRLWAAHVVRVRTGRLRAATGTFAVIVTADVPRLPPAVGPWFALSATVTLLLAAAVARRLARQALRPVRAVEEATERIARGDLDVAVTTPGGDDELSGLARAVDHMAAALRAARDAERTFLLSVSHDLRTPLTSIRGYGEAIADGAAPDPVRAGEVILAEARRLERLVDDLLDLAKLRAGEFSLHPLRVDVAALARDAVEGFRPAAEAAGVALAAIGDQPAMVVADPDRLRQVAANLLENALRFATTTVSLRAARVGASVELTVTDDGPGIAIDDRPHVFEHLYTGRAAGARAGSGLGLAIVAELVAASGGTVEAMAAAGGGTTMRVVLPAA